MSDVLNVYNTLKDQIEAIDEKLDSVQDSATAGKRKITNDLVSENEAFWKIVSDSIIEQMKNEGITDEQRTAAYYGITRALTKEFGDTSEKFVEARVPAKPEGETPTISPEDLSALQESRKTLYQQVKVLADLVVQTGAAESLEELDVPGPRKGAVGPRGKRALSYYSFEVDGKTYDKLTEVAQANGYEKVVELTKAFKAAEVNTTNPPRVFKVTLANGKELTATDSRTDEERGADAVLASQPETPEETPATVPATAGE